MAGKLGTEVDEAGDTIVTARLLTLTNNEVTFSGIIATQADVDVLQINTSSDGTLAVSVNPWFSATNTNGNNLDVEVQIFNSAGSLIGIASPGGVASASVTVNTVAGANYIRIDGVHGGSYSDYGSLGQYNLRAIFAADASVTTTVPTTAAPFTTRIACGDELESANTAAVVPSLPYTRNLSICIGGQNHFAVPVCAGGQVRADVTFDHSDGNIDVLFFFNGKLAGMANSSTDNETLTVHNFETNDRTAYFAVYGFDDASNPRYQITFTQVGDCTVDPTAPPTFNCTLDTFEPNDMPTSASALALPSRVQATYCWGDIDYYTVVLSPNATIRAQLTFEHVNADLELDIRVNGRVVKTSHSVNDFEELNFTNSNSQGNAVFVVWSFVGFGVPYTLKITQTSGVDCLATTTIAAPTTTQPDTTAMHITTQADATAAATTTTEAAMCSCAGSSSSTLARNKNYNLRFRATCSQGHQFRFCLKLDDSYIGNLRVEFQRRVGNSYQTFQAPQVLEGGEGERLCYAVDLPATHTERNDRYRLCVVNDSRRTYKIQTGVTQVRSNNCRPL
jgi:hypothetical protein